MNKQPKIKVYDMYFLGVILVFLMCNVVQYLCKIDGIPYDKTWYTGIL